MAFLDTAKRILDKHPIMTLLVAGAAISGTSFSVANLFLENKYETQIQNYQTTLSSISKRFGGKGIIDVTKIKIHKDSTLNVGKGAVYFPIDEFYATKDSYWNYKITNPIELTYLKNGLSIPDSLGVKSNPIDMPIHVWMGADEYRITELGWQSPVEPYPISKSGNLTVLNYPADPIVFKPTVTLQRYPRSGNSFQELLKTNMDSVVNKINFSDIPQNELMGHFLSVDMTEYFADIEDKRLQREVLLVEKNNDIIYASYLTTYNNLEINKRKEKSFFVWRELIILCTDKDLYVVEMETPGLEPRKKGRCFEKVAEWYNQFGVLVN